ncbi:MAG: hypothetical protein JSV42_02690 [Chloroflexota bacterium]|nr:MAG: hypothetical protein JSV42_02690 [Chloroflexota bacterium]
MKNINSLLIIILMSFVLSACDFGKLRVGEVRMMYGSNDVDRISYDIKTFTGIEKGEIEVEPGAVIVFNYSVELDKGELFIEWQDPQGQVVWQKDFNKSITGENEIKMVLPGTYRIFISGKGASGGFDVLWREK